MDTSFATKKQARRKAEEALKRAEGFMLFTVQKDGRGGCVYAANAFIDKDYASGMPAFINQVINQRKDQISGDKNKDGK